VAAKKSAKKKGPAKKKKSTPTGKAGKKHPCTLPEVCAFLAELSDYLKNDLIPDYTLLRRAMCHLERVVIEPLIDGAESQAHRLYAPLGFGGRSDRHGLAGGDRRRRIVGNLQQIWRLSVRAAKPL